MRYSRLQSVVLVTSILSVLVMFGGACKIWSQATSGDIVGTVQDKSGAVIANATVTVKNTATGVTTTTTANKVGDYHISNLLGGYYDITGSAQGFSSHTLRNLEVQLNKTSTANLVLQVAGASTSVEVTSEAPVVLDTTTAQLENTFEPEQMEQFPTASLGTSGVLNLALLIPGVSTSGGLGMVGPSVGGQRPTSNNYTVEGIDNNDKSTTGNLVYVPATAVGEFTTITNQFSPEFGHSVGGQFNTVVASGTNKIHGTAYEYSMNRNMNAENAIQGGKTPNPRYDFNRYGGQVGGPIKKDKIFYFVNYERQTTGQSSQYYLCTPTADGFKALSGAHGFNANNLAVYTKYVPASASQVDASADNACFNEKTGGQYLTVYDGTNYSATGPSYDTGTAIYGSGTATQINLGNYLVQAPNFTNFNALTTSGNWTISSKDSFRARYIFNRQEGVDPNDPSGLVLPAFYQLSPDRYHLIALSEYHTFTPNLTNEARLGFNRYYNITSAGNYPFSGLDSFPNLQLYDLGGINIGPDSVAPQSTIQNLYQFTDNISWIKGKHNWKFGFDGRKYISPQTFTQRVRGDYEWNYLTEYLHDLAPTYFGERSTGNFVYYGDQTAFYGYANDVWHVSNKLSLNYGLRYEYTAVPTGERMQELNSAASVPGLITFSAPQPQYTNVMPRVGINYAPNDNTSIRAGFGMGVDVLFDNLGILSQPPQFSSTNDVGVSPSPNPGDPNFLKNGGLPAGTGTLATFPTIAAQREATASFIPNQKLPYAENWSLGVQHVFHRDYTAELRYVGTRGIHLPTQTQLNIQPAVTANNQLTTFVNVPSLSDLESLSNTLENIEDNYSRYVPLYANAGFDGSKLTSYQPTSQSIYHGLDASLNRRMASGLLLNAAFTWSKTMDDATAPTYSTTLTPRRPQNSQDVRADYSLSALDRKFRFTLAATYDLPYFKTGNWMQRNLLGNWEVSPVYTYESPEYYTVLSGVNSNMNGDSSTIDRTIYNAKGVAHTGTAVTGYANPNLTSACPVTDADGNPTPTDPNKNLLCDADLVAYAANDSTARYIQAGVGTLPTAKRNSEPTSPIDNFDATAVKKFNITERYSMEFQAQAFNVLNHSQYIPGTIDNINYVEAFVSTFQEVNNSDFNKPGKVFVGNARTLQLALKLNF